MRIASILLLLPVGFVGCSTTSADDETAERSLLTSIVLFLPNRVVDTFDFARFGVSVGPGIGVDVRATAALQAVAKTRTIVGLGYQTLRHSPVAIGAETELGLGPMASDQEAGLLWYKSPTDLRLELHPLLVGAHVAIDPGEILDWVVGFIGLDPKEDDF